MVAVFAEDTRYIDATVDRNGLRSEDHLLLSHVRDSSEPRCERRKHQLHPWIGTWRDLMFWWSLKRNSCSNGFLLLSHTESEWWKRRLRLGKVDFPTRTISSTHVWLQPTQSHGRPTEETLLDHDINSPSVGDGQVEGECSSRVFTCSTQFVLPQQ